MISLPKGVTVSKFWNVELNKVGKGILYLTNVGILFEKTGHGAKFECNFEHLASFEAVKKDRLLVVIRTSGGLKSVEFKTNHRITSANQIEFEIAQENKAYANSDFNPIPDTSGVDDTMIPSDASNTGKQNDRFDQDALSRSEALWFQNNWNDIMTFLKPERVTYLNAFVRNTRIGTPNEDPYLLVVKYEDLTYKNFADLAGFLKWRYDTMTDKEADMISDVFQDFDNFSASVLEMDVQIASRSKNYVKYGHSLYEHVAIVAREKCESGKIREAKEKEESDKAGREAQAQISKTSLKN